MFHRELVCTSLVYFEAFVTRIKVVCDQDQGRSRPGSRSFVTRIKVVCDQDQGRL